MVWFNKEKKCSIDKYISEHSKEIIKYIDKNKRVLIDSNPATGKTRLFADLAINLKKGNVNGRIIFLTPFLIIQDQLETYLKKEGYGLDYILNGSTKSKKLKSSYVIISSTYHSFYHISDELNKNDYVIVDEAHTLLSNYKQIKQKRFYFDKVIPKLYNTNAKVVFMTGTPLDGLKKIFNTVTIKVKKKNPTKSKITVCFSNNDLFDVAIAFTEKIINEESYKSKSLNIIYVKNTSLCERIAFALNKEFSLNTKVLTSKHKEDLTYKEIVKNMTVPMDIQFLITTNVISTGANIENTNIGKALMLDEYSPIEIKQFSKRFRDKLDIEIEVVNNFIRRGVINDELKTKSDIINERNKQRDYFLIILKKLNTLKKNKFKYKKKFEYSFEEDNKGTIFYLIDEVLERFVRQEAYFVERLINVNFDANEIIVELNKYDDINANSDESLIDYKSTVNDELRVSVSSKLAINQNYIISDFITNEKAYLKSINKIIISKDKYLRYKYDRHFKQNTSLIKVSTNIENNVKSSGFRNNFVVPIFNHIKYLETASKSIYFEYNIAKNKQSKYKVSVYTSQLLYEYFDLKKLKSTNTLTLKESINKGALKTEIQFMFYIILEIFKYLNGKEYFHTNELSEHLNNAESLKKIRDYKNDLMFPLDLCKRKRSKYIFTTDLIIGMAQGVVLTRTEMINRKNSQNKSTKAYIIVSELPKKYNVKSNELDKDYLNIKSNTVFFLDSRFKQLKHKFNIKKVKKYIPTVTLLNYIKLSENYYKYTK